MLYGLVGRIFDERKSTCYQGFYENLRNMLSLFFICNFSDRIIRIAYENHINIIKIINKIILQFKIIFFFQIIREEREFLIGELKNLGFKVFNSDVNFILFKGSVGLDKSLLKREILIRNCGNFNGLDEGFYRIAVKKHDENAEFIRELGDICG